MRNSDDSAHYEVAGDLSTPQRCVRPRRATTAAPIHSRRCAACIDPKNHEKTRKRPAVGGTARAAEPTVASEPCTQVINDRSQDRPGCGAAFGGHRGIVCARLSPPEHRPHPLTPSSDVRRRNDGIAWLQLLWSSSGHPLSPPRATGQSRRASVAIGGHWQRLWRGADAVVS